MERVIHNFGGGRLTAVLCQYLQLAEYPRWIAPTHARDNPGLLDGRDKKMIKLDRKNR